MNLLPGARGFGVLLAAALLLGTVTTSRAQNTPTSQPGTPQQQTSPQPPEAPASTQAPTIETLSAEIQRLRKEAEEAPEDVGAAVTAELDAARAAIDRARSHDTERAGFERETREAPALFETIRAELAAPPGEPDLGLPESPSVSEVEQELAQARAELSAAKAEVATLEEEGKRRAERLATEIPAKITDVRDRRRALIDDLGSAPLPPDAPLIERARRVRIQSDVLAAEKHISKLEAEQQSYIARERLLPARKDRAQRRTQVAQARIDRLQTALSQAAKRQAAEAAEQATRLKQEAQRFAEGSPTLKSIVEENVELTSQLSGSGGITEKLSRTSGQISAVNAEIERLRERFREVHERVQQIGLTDAVGVILRRELDALRDIRRIRATSLAQSGNVSEAQLRVVQLDDRIDELEGRDVSTLIQRVLTELPGEQPEAIRQQVEQIAREVIEQRAKNLVALRDAYNKHVESLATLQGAEQELINVTQAYRTYIEERILWVRSVIRGRLLIRPAEVANALRWLFLSPDWLEAPGRIVDDLSRRPEPYIGLIALLLGAFAVQRRARRGIRQTAEQVASFRTDRFSATLLALLCTLLRALPWPLLVFAAGTILRLPSEQVPVALAVGTGLRQVAVAYLLIELLNRLLKPGGVADAHFRWRKAGSRVIRSNIAWFLPIVLPLLLIRVATQEQEITAYSESLGRLCFVAAMIALAIFTARVLSPRGAFIKPMLREGSWFERLRFVWYAILPGLAIVLAVIPLFGYYYSAVRLMTALRGSFWFILLVIIIHALLNRWLFMARRRLAVEQARKTREAVAAARAQAADSTSIDVPVEETVDIPALDQQTRRLFRIGIALLIAFGLYGIWSDVLPALNMLQRVQLWPTVTIVDLPLSSIDPVLIETDAPRGVPAPAQNEAPRTGAGAPGPANATTSPTTPIPGLVTGQTASQPASEAPAEPAADAPIQRITLADLGLAIVIAVITVLAGRNLPGLLEIAFLTRLPLDSGSRFAVTTVARYAIYIIGISLAFGAVNIGWSKIQWLAAALTFGLAFGLQEIFANFVSGLIILAERPVRVGDTVTVANVSGTVSRIQMRATTITDWDRKELIVPNKSFITDQVINWSLSSTILRVIVEVGVAYGSDVEKAERLLFEAADECELLIDDPAPRVLFIGFGDNSLNFRLQGFIGSIDNLLASRSALHFLINKKFAENGITIAFPQRDVHLDTASPIQIRVVDSEGRTLPTPDDPAAPGDPPVNR